MSEYGIGIGRCPSDCHSEGHQCNRENRGLVWYAMWPPANQCIVHLRYGPPPTSELEPECCVTRPISDWAFSQMVAELDRRDADAAYDFYRTIQGNRNSATQLFEIKVHTSTSSPSPSLGALLSVLSTTHRRLLISNSLPLSDTTLLEPSKFLRAI
jgi:hypothetical protein